jgi:glycosyltransferase involved in cell wall biosynthesis
MKVSIVTATYNSASTIRDTIKSVLFQTYLDLEFWIIDACSTDNTLYIIKEYENDFKGRLHYISEPDHGIYDAMNKGINLSTGEIVGVLNSDDFYTSSNVIERLVNSFNKDIDAVYGDVHFINDGEPDKCIRYYSSHVFRPCLLRFGFMPAHPSFYARRKVYEKYGTYSLDYKIASDYDIMVRFFYKYKIRAKYLKMDFVTMRTGGISTKNIHNRILITKEDVKACRKYGLYTNAFIISLKYIYKIFEFILK